MATKIFVVKRRSGIEYQIPVWNLGGYIETSRHRTKGWFRRELTRLAVGYREV